MIVFVWQVVFVWLVTVYGGLCYGHKAGHGDKHGTVIHSGSHHGIAVWNGQWPCSMYDHDKRNQWLSYNGSHIAIDNYIAPWCWSTRLGRWRLHVSSSLRTILPPFQCTASVDPLSPTTPVCNGWSSQTFRFHQLYSAGACRHAAGAKGCCLVVQSFHSNP